MSVVERGRRYSLSSRAAVAAAIFGAALSAGCSAERDIETSSIGKIETPSLTAPQLTVLAAFRSVCLGTSLDQRGADRALYVLGFKPAGEDSEQGLRRFAKGEARVTLTAQADDLATSEPGARPAAAQSVRRPLERSTCVVAHGDLGGREATAILGEAIRGAGLRFRPGDEGQAIVDGSDYAGVASVLRSLGESGLALTKTRRSPG